MEGNNRDPPDSDIGKELTYRDRLRIEEYRQQLYVDEMNRQAVFDGEAVDADDDDSLAAEKDANERGVRADEAERAGDADGADDYSDGCVTDGHADNFEDGFDDADENTSDESKSGSDGENYDGHAANVEDGFDDADEDTADKSTSGADVDNYEADGACNNVNLYVDNAFVERADDVDSTVVDDVDAAEAVNHENEEETEEEKAKEVGNYNDEEEEAKEKKEDGHNDDNEQEEEADEEEYSEEDDVHGRGPVMSDGDGEEGTISRPGSPNEGEKVTVDEGADTGLGGAVVREMSAESVCLIIDMSSLPTPSIDDLGEGIIDVEMRSFQRRIMEIFSFPQRARRTLFSTIQDTSMTDPYLKSCGCLYCMLRDSCDACNKNLAEQDNHMRRNRRTSKRTRTKRDHHRPLKPQTPAELGILPNRPRHQEFASVDARLKTFRNVQWRASGGTQCAANAGFYYTGSEDRVQCFYCAGCVQGWKESDNPIDEHRTLYPHCDFIKTICEEDTRHPHRRPETCVSRTRINPLILSAVVTQGYIRKQAEDAYENLQRSGQARAYSVDDIIASINGHDRYPSDVREEHSNVAIADLQRENEELKAKFECVICRDRFREIMFLPCKHTDCCALCSPNINSCLTCRTDIQGRVKVTFATFADTQAYAGG